jgi:hypothetical protein
MAREWLHGRIPESQLGDLKRQGFVSEERLPSGATCFKLRFREKCGRQRVVYIGTDPVAAAAIRNELTRLQTERRLKKESREAVREAKQILKRRMKALADHLAKRGFVFHGREIRCSRKRLAFYLEDPGSERKQY